MDFGPYQNYFIVMQKKIFLLSLCFLFFNVFAEEKGFQKKSTALVKIIKSQIIETAYSTGISYLSAPVESSLKNTPRHKFVPMHLRFLSYENRPLSIGHGQTISQPYIVALMTEVLKLQKDHVVLEIGTGSGYQAAVLSPLVKEVHTIEIIPKLATNAKKSLKKLGYKNVFSYTGDGYFGLEKVKKRERPKVTKFDAIIVTAASSHIPPPLIKQLKVGGKMIIPVGGTYQVQNLILLEKSSSAVKTKNILPVRFVPFTRE